MPSFRPTEPWPANPHTLAKIELVRRYVGKWVAIVGRSIKKRHMLVIDGFAGPGIYEGGEHGSPMAAIQAASKSMAIAKNAKEWQAGDIYFELVELNKHMFESLHQQTESLTIPGDIHVNLRHGPFEAKFSDIKLANSWAFTHDHPLFAFIDPFGAKGVPFKLVRDILSSGASELLLNLDADGIARIESYRSEGNVRLLNELFGDTLWVEEIDENGPFADRCRSILQAYRNRLHQIPGIRYSFPFEIQQSSRLPLYFLLFASKHQRGIEKMKETMREIGQDGSLRFCDAWNGQRSMFRDDDPNDWAMKLHRRFAGPEGIGWQEIVDFTLNETPFLTPKSMLRVLDSTDMLEVTGSNPSRKRNTFPDGTIKFIKFK
jgi:three-Cys-motif partner protein